MILVKTFLKALAQSFLANILPGDGANIIIITVFQIWKESAEINGLLATRI